LKGAFVPTGLPKLSPARNGDIPRLPWLLINYPEDVLLRERFNNSTMPLTALVLAPYLVTEEEGRFIFCAHDSKTHELVRLCITDVGHFKQVLKYSVRKKGQDMLVFDTKDLLVPSQIAFTARRPTEVT
jgi:hypothetical protein